MSGFSKNNRMKSCTRLPRNNFFLNAQSTAMTIRKNPATMKAPTE